MEYLKKQGTAPYRVAVIHGGPGANGEMAPVAEELSSYCGVLEPIQTATTIDGLIEELKLVLEKQGTKPMTLIGHSWGAWLVYLFAVHYPALVKKLVLVASAPFVTDNTNRIDETRQNRLSKEEGLEMKELWEGLSRSLNLGPDASQRFLDLLTKADSYDPLPQKPGGIDFHFDMFTRIWPEAAALRKSRELIKLGENISCPVIAIHGDADPHPFRGVQEPLSKTIKDFRFFLLKKCGHRPWIEKEAKEEFYRILRREL